jgi:ubiquinone/menaquinone biosynthesis C-methylase UbiE
LYKRFAAAYDEIMAVSADYDGVARRYEALIARFLKTDGLILLDLGCGTGRLTERFAESFDVIGAEISEDCLSIAASRTQSKVHGVQFIKQDMRRLDLYGTVDITVSAFDVLNHLTSLDDIKTAASRVKLFTNPGGVFLFDYNTPHKHEKILADKVFTYDTEHFYCVWENTYKGGVANSVRMNTARMNITCFQKGFDGRYERFEETITETAFDIEAVKQILTDVGFRVSITGFGSDEPPGETAEKVIFICEA